MKRIIVMLALILAIGATISCQQRYESPVDVAWDAPTEGFADWYEIGIRLPADTEVTVVATSPTVEYYLDLEAVGVFGVYVVLVRSVAFTEPDLYDYSPWIRSDNDTPGSEDVVWIDTTGDGEADSAQTFLVYRARPAGIPAFLRIGD